MFIFNNPILAATLSWLSSHCHQLWPCCSICWQRWCLVAIAVADVAVLCLAPCNGHGGCGMWVQDVGAGWTWMRHGTGWDECWTWVTRCWTYYCCPCLVATLTPSFPSPHPRHHVIIIMSSMPLWPCCCCCHMALVMVHVSGPCKRRTEMVLTIVIVPLSSICWVV